MNITNLTKRFGATVAVDEVTLELASGEIVGLVGENGAGKTTLMSIVAGELAADGGTISGIDHSAIGIVHQHFMLVPAFTIAENLALAAVDPLRFTSERTMRRDAERIIASGGIALSDVDRRVGDLSVGEKAKLELIKAIARDPQVLILDEPTSVLAPVEARELFDVIRRMAVRGTTVVFISHKIPEVLEVATRIVVMRRGKIVADNNAHELTAEQLTKAMMGAERGPTIAPAENASEPPASLRRSLAVDHISAERLHDVSFEVSGGETVAIIGVAGNGQSELAAILRGLVTLRAGTIHVSSIASERSAAVAHIPEDRTRDGLVAEMTIAENIALGARRWRPREAAARAARLIDAYNIRAHSPQQRAGSLSGGNQQKVIMARELDRHPDVIVAAEPTRGLDIEATRFVHDQLRAAAARDAAILLITSDLDEAFALGDAIHVIYRGRLSERMTPHDAAERAPALMAGLA